MVIDEKMFSIVAQVFPAFKSHDTDTILENG
jgi:hypothetical protein